jgi:hypothetical protein
LEAATGTVNNRIHARQQQRRETEERDKDRDEDPAGNPIDPAYRQED